MWIWIYSFNKRWWTTLCVSHHANWQAWSSNKKPARKLWRHTSSQLAVLTTGAHGCLRGWVRWKPQPQTNPADAAHWAALWSLAPLTLTLKKSSQPLSWAPRLGAPPLARWLHICLEPPTPVTGAALLLLEKSRHCPRTQHRLASWLTKSHLCVLRWGQALCVSAWWAALAPGQGMGVNTAPNLWCCLTFFMAKDGISLPGCHGD